MWSYCAQLPVRFRCRGSPGLPLEPCAMIGVMMSNREAVERVDLPDVNAIGTFVVETHSDIETVLAMLREGRTTLVSIEAGKTLNDWTQTADTFVQLVRAAGHHVALFSDSIPMGSRRWRKSTRALVRLRAFVVFPSKLASPSTRVSYGSDGNKEYFEIKSAPTTLRRLSGPLI